MGEMLVVGAHLGAGLGVVVGIAADAAVRRKDA